MFVLWFRAGLDVVNSKSKEKHTRSKQLAKVTQQDHYAVIHRLVAGETSKAPGHQLSSVPGRSSATCWSNWATVALFVCDRALQDVAICSSTSLSLQRPLTRRWIIDVHCNTVWQEERLCRTRSRTTITMQFPRSSGIYCFFIIVYYHRSVIVSCLCQFILSTFSHSS